MPRFQSGSEFLARAALSIGAVLATLLAAELALRLAGPAPARGDSDSGAPAWEPAERPEGALTLQVLHPFLGWAARADREILSRPPGNLTIAVFGGSVAGSLVANTHEQLGERLAELRPGVGRIRWLSLGRGGYKQPQQAAFLLELIALGLRIDLALNLDGYNEIALGFENANAGVHPLFPSHRHYSAILDASRGLRDPGSIRLVARGIELRERAERLERWIGSQRGFARSRLVGLLAGRLAARWRGESSALEARWSESAGDASRADLAELPNACPARPQDCLALQAEVWQRSSLAMHALASANGIAYLHLLQPSQYVRDAKPLSPDELRDAYHPEYGKHQAIDPGYRLLRAKGAELRARGVAFRDLSQLFAAERETLYIDDCCHVNRRGNEILARAVAEQIAALLSERATREP